MPIVSWRPHLPRMVVCGLWWHCPSINWSTDPAEQCNPLSLHRELWPDKLSSFLRLSPVLFLPGASAGSRDNTGTIVVADYWPSNRCQDHTSSLILTILQSSVLQLKKLREAKKLGQGHSPVITESRWSQGLCKPCPVFPFLHCRRFRNTPVTVRSRKSAHPSHPFSR